MAQSSKSPRKRQQFSSSSAWAAETELVGVTMELEPLQTCALYAQYTIGLHAWFLDQVRQSDPDLSAQLHDGQTEKAFTISGLEGALETNGRMFQLKAGQSYQWTITALSKPIAQWLAKWLQQPPQVVALRNAPLQVRQITTTHPPMTYEQLWQAEYPDRFRVALSFTSPTSFRRRGLHLPLPMPFNVFHSYLRRWNVFSGIEFEPDEFLEWVDESIVIVRHRLESTRVLSGKKGTVTAFTGAIELELSAKAPRDDEYEQLLFALVHLAPYCGTGHKTTFGLGQTRLGWTLSELQSPPALQTILLDRIAELTELFIAQRYRTGGDRASQIAETLATIQARREFGESLKTIAEDLQMPYETVKVYAKRAKRGMSQE
ncbi:CRISPR-associated endoribonuclease Cas6 [filamentous cyanobacterium CCP2]|nr:CRISPR-associated endoribonuclease Cas6 [filamentous cyanobacterium CCP2]